jgi:serine/threonine protein phosphatase PrpC
MMLDQTAQAVAQLQADVALAAVIGQRDDQADHVLSGFTKGRDDGFITLTSGTGTSDQGAVAGIVAATETLCQIKLHDTALNVGLAKPAAVLTRAIHAANDRIADLVAQNSDLAGMGTSALAVILRQNRLSWVSVGNCALYLIRQGKLRRLNKDHSMASQLDLMVAGGAMTAEVARNHPDRHNLTSVMNGAPIAALDCPTAPMPLWPDDVLILTTKGAGLTSDDLSVLQGTDSAAMADQILARLQAQPEMDQDNAAFAIIRLHLDKGAEEAPELPATEVEPAPEKQAYWYRGQQYFKD